LNVFNFPIYDIDVSGKYALSLNFTKLGFLRPGYGYINEKYVKSTDMKEDGVWLCGLSKRSKDLIITFERMLKVIKEKNIDFRGEDYYVNHLHFSPSGKRIVFLFIATFNRKRKVVAFSSDSDGNNLFLLNDGRKISHFVWVGDDKILTTADTDVGFGYYYLNDQSNEINPADLGKYSNNDGHPSVNGKIYYQMCIL
jgi:hypothetical protein